MQLPYPFIDWATWFYPRLHGALPRTVYPPWTYWLLSPLGVFHPYVGGMLLAALGVLIAYRYMGGRVVFLAATPPAMMAMVHGSLDLALVGVFLPGLWLAVILASCKPLVFWGYIFRRLLREGLVHAVPLLLVVALSVAVEGNWLNAAVPATASTYDHSMGSGQFFSDYSISLFPVGVVLGLALVLFTDSPGCWMLGGALCLPYLNFYHLVPVLAWYFKRSRPGVVVVVVGALWAYTLWRWA